MSRRLSTGGYVALSILLFVVLGPLTLLYSLLGTFALLIYGVIMIPVRLLGWLLLALAQVPWSSSEGSSDGQRIDDAGRVGRSFQNDENRLRSE